MFSSSQESQFVYVMFYLYNGKSVVLWIFNWICPWDHSWPTMKF